MFVDGEVPMLTDAIARDRLYSSPTGERRHGMVGQEQKHEAIAARILEACMAVYADDLVVCALFGSYARGTATPESDIDVLVVARNLPRGRMNRVQQFGQVEERSVGSRPDLINAELSPVIKTCAEVERGSPLFWDMTDDVVLLYDENGYFGHYLSELKRRLNLLGARKIVNGNAWYWILKEDFVPGEVFEI